MAPEQRWLQLRETRIKLSGCPLLPSTWQTCLNTLDKGESLLE